LSSLDNRKLLQSIINPLLYLLRYPALDAENWKQLHSRNYSYMP